MAEVIKTTFQLRRGNAAVWAKNNPVLSRGEPGFIIDENPEIVEKRVIDLSSGAYNKDNLKQFNLGKNYADYILSNAQNIKFDSDRVVPLSYRPFDKRYTYFDNKVIWRWREKVMRNMLDFEIDECENCLGRQAGRQAGGITR